MRKCSSDSQIVEGKRKLMIHFHGDMTTSVDAKVGNSVLHLRDALGVLPAPLLRAPFGSVLWNSGSTGASDPLSTASTAEGTSAVRVPTEANMCCKQLLPFSPFPCMPRLMLVLPHAVSLVSSGLWLTPSLPRHGCPFCLPVLLTIPATCSVRSPSSAPPHSRLLVLVSTSVSLS